MSTKLVAYFSASRVTAELAKTMAEVVGADLYEIKPEVLYTDADLNWRDKQSRSSIEMQNPASRPAIADKDAGIDAYDIVYLGFPIWWYVAPTIINTFLESYDFSGKTIIPFATSGSSGYGQATEMLRPSVPDTVIWKNGVILKGKASKAELARWIETFAL